jgi:4-aminobutyrate aminotransferase / (S)-3-amino-2-methylpropionate transaminase / 5-aminovalerate transaminase
MAATRTIDLRTAIPGPRSQAILERKDRVVAEPLSIFLPVVIDRGEGVTLTDVDGNTFIDFTGGVGCLNVGHAHPRVVEAVQEQAARFFHTDFTIVPYEVYVTLAERLIELSPFSGPAKAAFFNAGTEAIENAIKFARAYTQRPAVIAFEGGFHGRTLLAMSMTSKTHPYKAGLGPFAPEVYRLPFAQDYRGPSARDALAALERALVTHVAAESVAAVVIEPIQGEGGFVVSPPEFMEGLRRICDDNGIVLVVDEVQTGFGRTGKMFAIEHYAIEPDLITVAKAIAGGLPLSGVIGKAEIMDAPSDSAIGGTYVGNPVAQAAALAVLDVFEEEGLVERAAHLGEAIRARMESWASRWDAIGDTRGLGAMLAIELVHDRGTKDPAPEVASAIVEAAAERGLLLLKSGIYSNCIRVLLPLVISEAEVDEALGVWDQALETVLG